MSRILSTKPYSVAEEITLLKFVWSFSVPILQAITFGMRSLMAILTILLSADLKSWIVEFLVVFRLFGLVASSKTWSRCHIYFRIFHTVKCRSGIQIFSCSVGLKLFPVIQVVASFRHVKACFHCQISQSGCKGGQ